MILILKPNVDRQSIDQLIEQIKKQDVNIHYSQGATETILGLVGDTTHLDEDWLRAIPIVADVRRVSEPFKLANRRFQPENTMVEVAGKQIGEGNFAMIAGPCSVETEA